MIKDAQVKGLMNLMSSGTPLCTAAMKCGMSEPTARKYHAVGKLPSQIRVAHNWRTRTDPFESVWSSEVEPLLKDNPGLEAKTIFEHLQEKHQQLFSDGQLRTLQRRIRHWRALYGQSQEVFFPQLHYPGVIGCSDFTEMSSLNITINGKHFVHLLYHFVLTYSNWEHGTVCFTESFESLSEGLQNALWKLGGVPEKHRTDCLSAAVNNLKDVREFTTRYQSVMNHYGLKAQHTNPNSGNENGDVEQRHYRIKRTVDQTLMLRGSRDFECREQYELFLSDLFEKVNKCRRERLVQEIAVLKALPSRRLPVYAELKDTPVSNASTIRVKHNVYSVHSRLIGQHVDVHVYAGHLDIYYKHSFVERLDRLSGSDGHRINYRHVIDWLVRKPGAFASYRYKADLYPSSNFRIAYDLLHEHNPQHADREYIAILEIAAKHSETLANKALEMLIAKGSLQTNTEVLHLVQWLSNQQIMPTASCTITDVNLCEYDTLLTQLVVAS